MQALKKRRKQEPIYFHLNVHSNVLHSFVGTFGRRWLHSCVDHLPHVYLSCSIKTTCCRNAHKENLAAHLRHWCVVALRHARDLGWIRKCPAGHSGESRQRIGTRRLCVQRIWMAWSSHVLAAQLGHGGILRHDTSGICILSFHGCCSDVGELNLLDGRWFSSRLAMEKGA